MDQEYQRLAHYHQVDLDCLVLLNHNIVESVV